VVCNSSSFEVKQIYGSSCTTRYDIGDGNRDGDQITLHFKDYEIKFWETDNLDKETYLRQMRNTFLDAVYYEKTVVDNGKDVIRGYDIAKQSDENKPLAIYYKGACLKCEPMIVFEVTSKKKDANGNFIQLTDSEVNIIISILTSVET
jgi:hypothetical protein